MKVRVALAVVLLLTGCGRPDRSEAPLAPAALPATPGVVWSWHPIGGLAVVEGEVPVPTELILEGPSIRERRFAEPGPVRWEFFRPPEGEAATLRTADGRELARFQFSTKVTRPRPAASPQRLARQPESAAPAKPAAEPSRPRTRVEARLRNLPVTPIPAQKHPGMPDASEAPAQNPQRASVASPMPIEPVPPRLRTPSPSAPPVSLPIGPMQPWPGMGEALNLTRGPGGHKRLLLSFDGGSSAEVATEVLDLLKARGVRTTLFLTGAFIQRFPALVRRMAAEGHELGNHTMNHPHFAPDMKRDPKWTRERIQRELLDADAALVRLLGRPMDPFWRAPYGEHTAEIRRWAEELGYRHVGWSEGADTLDWATPKERRLYRSGEAIVQRLYQRLGHNGDGLIVLMHLGSGREEGDRPTDGLGAFMDRAQKEGWTFVSAGAFLRDLGKPAWDPHQRLALLNGTHAQSR